MKKLLNLGSLDLGIIYFAWLSGLFWFRFFRTGYGLYFHDTKILGIPFSERMEISRTLHIGRWRIWGLAKV